MLIKGEHQCRLPSRLTKGRLSGRLAIIITVLALSKAVVVSLGGASIRRQHTNTYLCVASCISGLQKAIVTGRRTLWQQHPRDCNQRLQIGSLGACLPFWRRPTFLHFCTSLNEGFPNHSEIFTGTASVEIGGDQVSHVLKPRIGFFCTRGV